MEWILWHFATHPFSQFALMTSCKLVSFRIIWRGSCKHSGRMSGANTAGPCIFGKDWLILARIWQRLWNVFTEFPEHFDRNFETFWQGFWSKRHFYWIFLTSFTKRPQCMKCHIKCLKRFNLFLIQIFHSISWMLSRFSDNFWKYFKNSVKSSKNLLSGISFKMSIRYKNRGVSCNIQLGFPNWVFGLGWNWWELLFLLLWWQQICLAYMGSWVSYCVSLGISYPCFACHVSKPEPKTTHCQRHRKFICLFAFHFGINFPYIQSGQPPPGRAATDWFLREKSEWPDLKDWM